MLPMVSRCAAPVDSSTRRALCLLTPQSPRYPQTWSNDWATTLLCRSAIYVKRLFRTVRSSADNSCRPILGTICWLAQVVSCRLLTDGREEWMRRARQFLGGNDSEARQDQSCVDTA
jgi:hypothetical protein